MVEFDAAHAVGGHPHSRPDAARIAEDDLPPDGVGNPRARGCPQRSEAAEGHVNTKSDPFSQSAVKVDVVPLVTVIVVEIEAT